MGADYKYHEVGAGSNSPLADDETPFPTDLPETGRSSGLRRVKEVVRAYWWIVDVIGLFAIVALSVCLFRARSMQLNTTGDITGFAPKFDEKVVSFKPEPQYFPDNPDEWFSDKTQQAWLDLVPIGLGYVKVNETYKYSHLPHPLKDWMFTIAQQTVFTTSMTHQLHCLHSSVHFYYGQISKPPREPPQDLLWHLRHCFDYLRQSIMCSGDVALEGAETTFPAGNGGSDGWDAKHVCKDYSQIKNHLEKHRANDLRWI